MDASASTSLCGLRLLIIQPAMGFGPARLVMAPAGVAGARLPRGVHAVEGIAAPAAITGARLGLAFPASTASSRRHSVAVSAVPTGGRARVPAFLAPPVAGAPSALDRAIETVVVGALSSSSSTGRRGVVARGATTSDFYGLDDDSKRAEERIVLCYDHMRSVKHIGAWIGLARLKSTFEVAFDAGVLDSGRDLGKLLDEIGEIDPTARIFPWTTDACLARLRAVIGKVRLEELLSARTPQQDEQFRWSAATAEAVILAIQKLMGTLHAVIFLNEGWLRPSPWSLLYDSCPALLNRLMGCVEELSSIVESTKFKRPQNCIRFGMLEAHALALEHAYAVALEVYEQVSPGGADGEGSKEAGKALRNRRLTLSEEDMGPTDYMSSIGRDDTKMVIQCLDHASWEVRERVLGPGWHLLEG